MTGVPQLHKKIRILNDSLPPASQDHLCRFKLKNMSSLITSHSVSGLATLKNNHYFLFIIIFILAFAARIYVWVNFLGQPDNFIQPDTSSYLSPGVQLIEKGTFPSFRRTPIYPLYLAIIGKVISFSPAVLAFTQVVLSIMTMGVSWLLCVRAGVTNLVTLLLLFFMALDFQSILNANFLLSETLFTFLLLLCIFCVWYFYCSERSFRADLFVISLTGICFSLMTMCRPIGFLLFIPVTIWLYRSLRTYKRNLIILLVSFCAFSSALPCMWTLRNHALTGKYFLTTISSVNLFEWRAAWNISQISNVPFEEVKFKFRQLSQNKKEQEGLNEGELADWRASEGIKILLSNPTVTCYQAISGFMEMYFEIDGLNYLTDKLRNNSIESEYFSPTAIVVIIRIVHSLLLYSGFIILIVLMCRGAFYTQEQQLIWLMLITVGYFTFFSVGAEAYARFRVPIVPTLSLLGALAWAKLLEKNWGTRKVCAVS